MDNPSKQQIRDYVQGGGFGCPQCGSDNTDPEAPNTDHGLVKVAVACLACGFEYDDVYQLVGIKHDGIPTTYCPDEDAKQLDDIERAAAKTLNDALGFGVEDAPQASQEHLSEAWGAMRGVFMRRGVDTATPEDP